MRLPGTRYQEHGWEYVRKLLGQCSLQALARGGQARLFEADGLPLYVDLVAEALHASSRSARATAPGNSYGDSVSELALTLVYELRERPGEWSALCGALEAEHQRHGPSWDRAGGEALLRKKFNDMYAVLRDKVDADNYQAACGRACSANRMYAYRMLDTAWGDIARLFAAWRENAAQVGAILGRAVEAMPVEARQVRSISECRPEWVLRWSESRERFTGSAGPLHTRSKRFASLKDNPSKIGAMLREIGEYEELSANRDQDWLLDASEATLWLDDYWRVLDESAHASTPGPDQILEAREEELDLAGPADAGEPAPPAPRPAAALAAMEAAHSVSLPPRFVELARAAQEAGSWSARMLAGDSLPVRLAVYLKLLGAADDSYPSEWLDPATAELPTMQQLAALDQVSLPTLRKRRDAAIERLKGLRA
ncbi:MAG: hypothetical protein ACJ8LG_18625 [Massilia sp.]